MESDTHLALHDQPYSQLDRGIVLGMDGDNGGVLHAAGLVVRGRHICEFEIHLYRTCVCVCVYKGLVSVCLCACLFHTLT